MSLNRPTQPGQLGNDPRALDTATLQLIESYVSKLSSSSPHVFFPFAGNGAVELAVIAHLRDSGHTITATLLDVSRPAAPMPPGVTFATRWGDVDPFKVDIMIAFNPVCEPYFSALAYPLHLEHNMRLRSTTDVFPIKKCPEGVVLCAIQKARIPMLAFINRWGTHGFDHDEGYFSRCITSTNMSTYKKLQAIARLSGKDVTELVVYCDN